MSELDRALAEQAQAEYENQHAPAGDAVSGPVLIRLSSVERRQIEWLWQQRFALGKLALIFGDPGKGKSTITLDMAARVTTGGPWPDGSGSAPKGTVIILSCEDDLADTIAPRLDKAGADSSKIVFLAAIRRQAEGGKVIERSFTLEDVEHLRDAIEANPDTRLVIIDPVSGYIRDADSHNNTEIRGLLAPLAKLASDCHVAVVMVTHMSKAAGGRAIYRAMGSLAFIAAARSAWVVVPDNDNPKRRLFLPAKNNIGNDETGLAYSIVDGAISWERGAVQMKADEALASELSEHKPGPEPEARNAATEWLADLLDDGPMESAKVKEEAKAAELAWRTVRRAQEELRIKPYRDQFTRAWTWKLPANGELGQDPLYMDNLDKLDNIPFLGGNHELLPTEGRTCPSGQDKGNEDKYEDDERAAMEGA